MAGGGEEIRNSKPVHLGPVRVGCWLLHPDGASTLRAADVSLQSDPVWAAQQALIASVFWSRETTKFRTGELLLFSTLYHSNYHS